jgi:hypothetical protein
MCLTLHFVDSEWKIHKKIINFCQITGHTGDMIGQYVDGYLKSWGLSKILSITVDHRTCLTPKMVEALVCTQDWLKGASLSLFSHEDIDEIHRLEQGTLILLVQNSYCFSFA